MLTARSFPIGQRLGKRIPSIKNDDCSQVYVARDQDKLLTNPSMREVASVSHVFFIKCRNCTNVEKSVFQRPYEKNSFFKLQTHLLHQTE